MSEISHFLYSTKKGERRNRTTDHTCAVTNSTVFNYFSKSRIPPFRTFHFNTGEAALCCADSVPTRKDGDRNSHTQLTKVDSLSLQYFIEHLVKASPPPLKCIETNSLKNMQASIASRCSRIINHAVSYRVNCVALTVLKPPGVPLHLNLSSVATGARTLSTKPKLWRSVRTAPAALKLNAFLSDFPARPPQNAVSSFVCYAYDFCRVFVV